MICLIGYLVTEGNWSFSKEIGRGTQLSVSQSIDRYFTHVKTCIDNLGLNYRLRERSDGVCEFIFDAESRDRIIDYYDGWDIHDMPSIVYQFSKRQLNLLYTAMMNGDGSWSNMTYCSKRKKLAVDFQNVVAMIGYRTSLRQRKSGMYDVCTFSKAKNSVNNFVLSIEKEEVAENIWCVRTKNNGTIITRKNESIFVSGNCEAMHLILQQEIPEDFVIATGITTTVRDFVKMAFTEIGVELTFKGKGEKEIAVVKSSTNPEYKLKKGTEVVAIDPRYYRPTEVELLIGDPTKAKTKLGWEPKYTLPMLVKEMVDNDLHLVKKAKLLEDAGFAVLQQYE
jgi:GDP-mannose 4,6 dehydratase